jgi:hypothetical protein
LKTADLVIADLTLGNPNVYYELSLRHALGKRAIHICHDDTRPSFDIIDNRTIFFTFHIQRVESAREQLEKQISRTHEPEYKVRNPIVDTISLIQLEQSAEPIERHLATLSRDVEQLNLDIQTIKTNLNSWIKNDEASYLESRVRTTNDILTARRGTVFYSRPFGDYMQGVGPGETPIVLRASAGQPSPASQGDPESPEGLASEKPAG